jgi:hypothetical protein
MKQTRRPSTAMRRKSKRHQHRLRSLDTKSSFVRSTSTHLQTSPHRRSSLIILATHRTTPSRAARHLRASHHLQVVTCRLHAVSAVTAPAVAAHRKRCTRSVRLWSKNGYLHHQLHLKRQSFTRIAGRSLKSACPRHHTLVHWSSRTANIAASAISRPKSALSRASAALYAWSVRTRTRWHSVCVTGPMRNTSLLSTATDATVRSYQSWRETLALQGTSSAWRRTEKVGWPWFGLLIDSTSVRWVTPCGFLS